MASGVSFAVLTVSDSRSCGNADDKSGDTIVSWLQSNSRFQASVMGRKCVPDDETLIKSVLIDFCDNLCVDCVLTTGGTGFSSRDVTPEATNAIVSKEAPGMVVAMLLGSLKITPMAMLSRPACGIRGNTMIINLPGSTKGALECLEIVSVAFPHAVDLLRGSQIRVQATHTKVQSQPYHQHGCSGHHLEHGVDSHCDVSNVAHRLRVSPYPAISMDKALGLVLEQAILCDAERVSYVNCIGRILARDVFASDPLPPFPAAIKDGYAVIASDGTGKRSICGDSTAGSEPGGVTVTPGFCVRINTGAPLPLGCDAVVQVEDTKLLLADKTGLNEIEIEILVAAHPGKDIRPVGCDIARGQKVLTSGSKLGYSEMGILATVGVTEVPVYKLPSVGILSTGNELVVPGLPLKPGKIRDSNKTVLRALFKEHGFPTVDLGIAQDNVESLVDALRWGIESADVVISTGGVSMGDKDLLKPVLKEHFSAELHYGRVFMKPGLPNTFATVMSGNKKKLIFCLPGNPVSAAVSSNLFVIPALRKMSGHANPFQTIIKVKVLSTIQLDPRPEYQRVVLNWSSDSSVPTAEVTGNQISSRLLSMTCANGLLVLPPRTEKQTQVAEGEIIDCIVIGPI